MKKKYQFFSLQEYRLLQLSSIIFETKSYHWLRSFFFEKRDSGVNENYFLERNITDEQLILMKNNKDLWLQQARLEWKYKNAKIFTEKQACDLCNQPHLETCYFENKKSKKIIQVGTTCLYTLGDEYEKSRNRELKSERELNNISEIQKKIPNIRNLVEDWAQYLSKTPVIVSTNLEIEYRKICKKLVIEYERAVKSKRLERNISELLITYDELIFIKSKINDFIENNKNKRYILSKNIFNEMKFNQSDYANIAYIVTSQYNSLITIQTAHRIKSKILYENFMNDFNKLNKDMRIESINDFNFKISFKQIKGIKFLVSGESFIFSFADLVFNQPAFDSDSERLDNILKDIRFFDHNNSKEAINRVLRETNIKYKAYNFRTDPLINKDVREELESIKRMMEAKKDYSRILYNINSILYEFEECEKINKYYTLYVNEKESIDKDNYKSLILKKLNKLDKKNVKILNEINNNIIIETQLAMVEFVSINLTRELEALRNNLIFISNSNTNKIVSELNKLLKIDIIEESKKFYTIFNIIKNYSLPRVASRIMCKWKKPFCRLS